MINALSPSWIVRGLTLLVICLCAGAIYRSSPSEAGALIRSQGQVVLAVNAVVLLLTFGPIFRFVHWATFARFWWFPLLDGQWDVTVWSNWPRVRAMLAAAKQENPAFDPLTQDPPGDPQPIKMVATIESSLFGIEMTMNVPGTERRSETVFVRPEWRRPAPPTITYVYKQSDHGPVLVTDVAQHLGAGVLAYVRATGELRGEYWTQRQGSKGLNTAGTLILKRLSSAKA